MSTKKEKMYSIYKITNQLNGKSYVGFTSRLKERKYHHYRKSNYTPLGYAMKKYGTENFKFEVIYQSKDGKHCLEIMEPHFIKEYNSFGKRGYNRSFGGETTGNLIPWNKGLTKNTHPSLLIVSNKNKGVNKRKSHPHTEEWKQHLRENNPGGKATKKPVYKLDIYGNIIEEFESASYINKMYKKTHKCIHGYIRRKTLFDGHYWVYK